jgi:hypothetical protein
MWQAVARVSEGVTLVAFLAAALAGVLYRKAVIQERLVRSFSAKNRLKAMPVLWAYLPAEAVELAPEQQFLLALEQIMRRAERWRQGAIVLVPIVLISAVVALASYGLK